MQTCSKGSQEVITSKGIDKSGDEDGEGKVLCNIGLSVDKATPMRELDEVGEREACSTSNEDPQEDLV